MVRRGTNLSPRVLLLAERPKSALWRHLISSGYDVMETFTTDRAVAVCVNDPIDAVVLDQQCFIETDGWNVAQSVKAVRANVCVLLAMRAQQLGAGMPSGVDAVVPADDPESVTTQLQKLIGESGASGEIVRTTDPVPLSHWVKGTESSDD